MTQICLFNDCNQPVLSDSFKCQFHRHRSMCKSQGCRNQVYARHLCTRHGGKRECQYEGCDHHARVGKYCSRHGGSPLKKLCIYIGCTKLANAKQLCVGHGGRRQCQILSCTTHARRGGLCRRHSNANMVRARNIAQQPASTFDLLDVNTPIEFYDIPWLDINVEGEESILKLAMLKNIE